MANKRTRERHLAKLAARRQAERSAQIHRRNRIIAVVGGVLTALVVAGVGLALKGGGTSATPTPSATSTPSPSPSQKPQKPGTQTGTVTPQPAPTQVACGATAPKQAGMPKPQFTAPPMTIDQQATYTATFETSCGQIEVRLDAKASPETVNSFVFLADHHYFDGQYFHRLDTSIDVIQGGDPTGSGSGGPGYTIKDEYTGKEQYTPGTLAMANTGQPNSGGSQFFVITGPNGKSLPPNYTIFGRVVSGLDVAVRIQRIPIQDPSAGISGQQPKQAVYIDRITIAEGK